MKNIAVNGYHLNVEDAVVVEDGKVVQVTHTNGDVENFRLKDKSKAEIKNFTYPDLADRGVLAFETDETYAAEDFKGMLVWPDQIKLEKEQKATTEAEAAQAREAEEATRSSSYITRDSGEPSKPVAAKPFTGSTVTTSTPSPKPVEDDKKD